jgi:hypothetical protein
MADAPPIHADLCPGCEYDLAGLTDRAVCPECGCDISNRRAALSVRDRRLRRRSILVFLLSPGLGAAAAAVTLGLGAIFNVIATVPAIVVYGVVCLGAATWCLKRTGDPPVSEEPLETVLASVVVVIAYSAVFWSCVIVLVRMLASFLP